MHNNKNSMVLFSKSAIKCRYTMDLLWSIDSLQKPYTLSDFLKRKLYPFLDQIGPKSMFLNKDRT